ncbi:hypothetical protein BOX15_Mlig005310g3, partial [Macrostomum lignano]
LSDMPPIIESGSAGRIGNSCKSIKCLIFYLACPVQLLCGFIIAGCQLLIHSLGGGSSDDSLVAVGLVTGLLLVVASLVAMVNLSRRKLHIASTAVKVPPCLVASLLLGLACPPGCLATGIILLRHSLASSVSQEAACGDPPLLNEIASGANYTTQSSRIASSSSIEAPLIWSRACLLASLSVAMVTACLLTVALAMEIRRFRRMRHRMERTLLHRMDSDGHRCDDGAVA